MHGKQEVQNLFSHMIPRAATAGLAIVFVLELILVFTQSAQAQTFQVIHTFTGGLNGKNPDSTLTVDQAGNIYGTTDNGGDGRGCGGYGGCGTVFKLQPTDSGWALEIIHDFNAGDGYFGRGGESADSQVVIGPGGGLYGTTAAGGPAGGCNGLTCGTLFNLKAASSSGQWTDHILYLFGGSTGEGPAYEPLTFDQYGNVYGTCGGGPNGNGIVFKLAPSEPEWTESILYSFTGSATSPSGGVIFDPAGNLYGATRFGPGGTCPDGCGTVFQLTPSESGWTENTLYSFQGGSDGTYALAGVISDPSGNLYGATSGQCGSCNGSVFMLAPSGGDWTFSSLHSFATGEGPAERRSRGSSPARRARDNGRSAFHRARSTDRCASPSLRGFPR